MMIFFSAKSKFLEEQVELSWFCLHREAHEARSSGFYRELIRFQTSWSRWEVAEEYSKSLCA
jgi:hypothetical protein